MLVHNSLFWSYHLLLRYSQQLGLSGTCLRYLTYIIITVHHPHYSNAFLFAPRNHPHFVCAHEFHKLQLLLVLRTRTLPDQIVRHKPLPQIRAIRVSMAYFRQGHGIWQLIAMACYSDYHAVISVTLTHAYCPSDPLSVTLIIFFNTSSLGLN